VSRAAVLACRATILLAILPHVAGCVSSCSLRTVKDYREALARRDESVVRRYIAPGARLWFEKKEGPGEPLGTGGGRWKHWDEFFHGHSDVTDWRAWGREVSATARETNDLYRLLEWEPAPYRITWWLDPSSRISEALITSIPVSAGKGRLSEFKDWARKHRPDELAYLMPDDEFDPTGDRAERFRAILLDWRAAAGLPRIELGR